MKTFKEIPTSKPITKLLDSVSYPSDLKKLNKHELVSLADELREFLLYSVGQSGGHLGAGLGVIELTIVLHYIFNAPKDKIIWDVGHQAYPHKILTGRKDQIETIRKSDGERQPFNGTKLKAGMLRALEKRPLSSEEVDAVFGNVLTQIRQLGEREIPSRMLGEIVMKSLKSVDQVAYVRFASVYRDFQDIEEFAQEISTLSKEKKRSKTTKK